MVVLILCYAVLSCFVIRRDYLVSRRLLLVARGLPALIDLAALRDAVRHHGVDVSSVNPSCHVDLILDQTPSAAFAQRCTLLVNNSNISCYALLYNTSFFLNHKTSFVWFGL